MRTVFVLFVLVFMYFSAFAQYTLTIPVSGTFNQTGWANCGNGMGAFGGVGVYRNDGQIDVCVPPMFSWGVEPSTAICNTVFSPTGNALSIISYEFSMQCSNNIGGIMSCLGTSGCGNWFMGCHGAPYPNVFTTQCNFVAYVTFEISIPPDCDDPVWANVDVCRNCSLTQSSADSLLAQAQASCEARADSTIGLSGEFAGEVYQQTNSNGVLEYCITDTCYDKYTGECPEEEEEEECPEESGNGGGLLARSMFTQPFDEPEEEICRDPLAVARQQKNVLYYNAKGQVIGSSRTGLPKTRMPAYTARQRFREPTFTPLVEESYQSKEKEASGSGYVLARQGGSGSTCGTLRGDYGIVVNNPNAPYRAGITCPNIIPKISFAPDSSLTLDTNRIKCSGAQKCEFNNATATLLPYHYDTVTIHVVDTNFTFRGKDMIRLTQAQIDSIRKHELGHKKDIERCLIPKLQPKKLIFEGCFSGSQLDSINTEELKRYENLRKTADSIYHHNYGHSGYPNPEEEYVCPY